MSQPTWKHVGSIGDKDPIAYGGGFVYIDTTGVYAPEMVWFEPGTDEQWHKTEGATKLQAYRFVLEPPRFKTLRGGQWDTTKPENMVWHNEWFVKDLASVATSCGHGSHMYLLRGLLSKDPMQRARAYWDILGYFCVHEFDSYPVEMTEDEAYSRFAAEMSANK